MADYRWKLKPPECRPGRDPEAIMVCGRRRLGPEPRLPPGTYGPDPGRFVAGEPRGMGPECIQRCPRPVSVDLIAAGRTVARAIDKLLNGE